MLAGSTGEAQGKQNGITSLAVSSRQLHVAAFCTGWEGQGAQLHTNHAADSVFYMQSLTLKGE